MAAKGEENTGVIQKIQKRSGCLLLVIGAAMLAFVLTDIISGMGRSIGMKTNVVGEIAGEEIALEDFNRYVELEIEKYKRGNPNRQITEEFQSDVRDQVWNKLIQERILGKQYDILGIDIHGDEFYEAAIEDEQIVRAFSDSMGIFQEPMFKNFLEVQMQEDENLYLTWKTLFEDPLIERLEARKYQSLLKAGVYATSLDAKADFDYRNVAVSAQAIGLPFITISDSAISYTDDDLLDYMNDHYDDYKQDEYVNIEFAVLDIRPSAEDSAAALEFVTKYAERFRKAEDDSAFVTLHQSRTPFNPAYLAPGDFMNEDIDELIFAADSGELIGPKMINGAYALYKISDVKQDSVPSVRARHILLLVDGTDTSATIAKGKELIKELKAGTKNFEDEAIGNIDRTGPAGGDLGWMKKGVGSATNEDVRKAIFKGNYNKGDYFITTSNFGVHVVEVTSDKVTKRVQLAVIDKPVIFSSNTSRMVEKQANDIFFMATQEGGDFREAIQNKGFNVNEQTGITEKDDKLAGIRLPKTIVRWLYEEGRKEGDISDPFFMRDQFVIVKATKIAKEGLPSIDDARDRLTIEYLNGEKGKILLVQVQDALKKVDNMDDLAKTLNTQVRVIPHAIMQENTITGIGVDHKVLGLLFGSEYEKISKPVIGEAGVYVVRVDGQVTMDREMPEFKLDESKDMVKRELVGGAVEQVTVNALREKYGVVDKRYKYF